MRADIIYHEWLNSYPGNYDGEGTYLLVCENSKVLNAKYCSSREFAEKDLTTNTKESEQVLYDYCITEVYSNGVLIWKTKYKGYYDT